MNEPRRRSDDANWITRAWDWIDARQIDAYAVSLVILFGTMRITDWAMSFVDKHPEIDGLKAAAIITAIMLPWSGLQTAAIKFLFDARQKSFQTP